MEVQSIAVIGAGAMGREIAYSMVLGGYRIILEDVSRERLAEGLAWIKQTLEDDVSRGNLSGATQDAAIRLLSAVPNVEEAIRGADFVIETVPDELEMKLELFTIFDKFAKPGAILASTTRSFSVSDMSDVTVCRDRCIGMRFFPAVPKARMIEILKTAFTSEDTLATCREVARRMGGEVIFVNESPDKKPGVQGSA